MKILDRSMVSAAFDCRRILLLGINVKLNHGHFQFNVHKVIYKK